MQEHLPGVWNEGAGADGAAVASNPGLCLP
jgi:hypothetical protein